MRVGYFKNRLARMQPRREVVIKLISEGIEYQLRPFGNDLKVIKDCSLAVIESTYQVSPATPVTIESLLKGLSEVKESYILGINIKNFYSGGIYIEEISTLKREGDRLIILINEGE